MPDDIVAEFQSRRPLLMHVANEVQSEIAELLADAKIPSRTDVAVMTADEFQARLAGFAGELNRPLVEMDDQVHGVVEVSDIQQVTPVEKLIGELHTIHSTQWLSSTSGGDPVREMTCVIPTQAMPHGWSERSDVPSYYRLRIEIANRTLAPDSASVPILFYPEANVPFPLIMKGGGIKGLAYVGAIEELRKRYTFNWFVGTSAGAITAVLLGAGYTPDELTSLMGEKNFRDFFDAPWYRALYNLVVHHGCYSGDALTAWLDDLLARKLNSPTRVRLSQLPHRVTVYVCRVGKSVLRFDSVKNDADAAYAARCSMSIPWFFIPQQDQGLRTFDGGIQHNYPVEQFLLEHPDTRFVSLYLGSAIYEPVRRRFIFSDLLSIILGGSDAEAVQKYREHTVIIDPRPIGTLDFDLTSEEKEYLLACGRAGALTHLCDGSDEQKEACKNRDALKVTVELARASKRQTSRRRRLWRLVMCAVLLVAVICGLFWAIRGWFTPPDNAQPESTNTKSILAVVASPDDAEPDPPEDFPRIESSGLTPLSDRDRMSQDYEDTTIIVANETQGPIKLAYSYIPRPSDQQASHYAHRQTELIEAGHTVAQREAYFGGPVQVSVLTEGKWHPTKVWIDLRVVARRKLTISREAGGFRCDVEF